MIPLSLTSRLVCHGKARFEKIPHSLVALLARCSIAAVFWKSGQTRIEGFALDIVDMRFDLGWPRLADSTVPLFAEKYRLPLIPPEWAARWPAWPNMSSRP